LCTGNIAVTSNPESLLASANAFQPTLATRQPSQNAAAPLLSFKTSNKSRNQRNGFPLLQEIPLNHAWSNQAFVEHKHASESTSIHQDENTNQTIKCVGGRIQAHENNDLSTCHWMAMI